MMTSELCNTLVRRLVKLFGRLLSYLDAPKDEDREEFFRLDSSARRKCIGDFVVCGTVN